MSRSVPPMNRRRALSLLALPLAGAPVLGAAACSSDASASASSAGAPTPFTLRVGFISNTPTPAGPEGWAFKKQTLVSGLAKVGVSKVDWLSFKNGPDLSAAATGGSLDLAILGDTPALTAKANGLDTRLVNQSVVGQDTWLFAKKNGPTSVAALKGQTIATQVGSYMYRYLVALLQQEGIADTVKVTHVYTTAAVAALHSGGIAAYAAPAGSLTTAFAAAGFPLLDKASVDHKDLLGTSATIITAKALAAHPTLPAAWNAVRSTAVADIQAHPTQYYAFAATAMQTTAATIRTSLPVTVYHADAFTPAGLKLLAGTNSFLTANKLEKSAVDINSWKLT